MSLLGSLRNDSRLWEQRAVLAPKVVMLRPDVGTASGSPNSSSRSDADEDGYHVSAVRYLDEYGHDLTPYYKECTTDLEGLQYDLAFGEDLTSVEMDNRAAFCWWLGVATVCIRTAVTILSTFLDTLAFVGVCFLVSLWSTVASRASEGMAGVRSVESLQCPNWSLTKVHEKCVPPNGLNDPSLQTNLPPCPRKQLSLY